MDDASGTGPDPGTPREPEPPDAWQGRIAGMQRRGRVTFTRLQSRVTRLRERSTLVDLAFRVNDRDRDAAGTLLGSALALRLFLFFVPLVLFAVGLAGLVGRHAGYDSMSSDAGIAGSIGQSIDTAFSQSASASWFAALAGLFGMATTGWSLSRALVVSSALSWRLGGRQKLNVRAVGTVVGLIVGIGLITVILNRIRASTGVAVVSVSFAAVLVVYLGLWLVVFQVLPSATTDPGSSLPGAALTAAMLTGMQAVSVLYVPSAIERSSNLYGAIGITVATLGWFFILGRVVVYALSINAVVYERIGSVSEILFILPGFRVLPRRYPIVARYFDLGPHDARSGDESTDADDQTA